MMTIPFARPDFRPLPPIAATLALACALLWFAPPAPLPFVFASLAGAAALALAVRHLLVRLDAPQPNRAAALILPAVVLDIALFGQQDMIWVAPCIMALAAAVDRRHRVMLVWFGLALGIKVQALLFAPFLIALLINRRVPLRLWLITPLVAAATILPVWLAGWPDAVPASLTPAAPSLWRIIKALPLIGTLPLDGLALATALGTAASYIAWFSTRRFDRRALLAPALLAPLVIACLLPHLQQGDFFLAGTLTLVMALTLGDKSSWHIAAMVQAGSLLALFGSVDGLEAMATVGAIPMIVAALRVAAPLIHPFANDNPLLARA